jgi:hypothetical protein
VRVLWLSLIKSSSVSQAVVAAAVVEIHQMMAVAEEAVVLLVNVQLEIHKSAKSFAESNPIFHSVKNNMAVV